MQSEPITIKVPVTGKTVKIRPYATGRVKQEIQRALFGDSEIKTKASAARNEKEREKLMQQDQEITFRMANINESRNAAISGMVLEVDGNSESVLDAVLDLPEADYQAVLDKVDELTKDTIPSQKKLTS